MPIVRTSEDTRIRGGPAAWLALLARALRPAARAFRVGSPRGAVRDAETASPRRLGGFTFLVPGLGEGPAPPQAPADPPDPGPFVVVSRVPRADLEAVASPAPSILYPGVHWWSRDPERPRAATALPGVVVGPPAGPIRSIDPENSFRQRH